jgi:opacity protein-like surface antigen
MRARTSPIAGLLLLTTLPALPQPIEADPNWQAPPPEAPPPAEPGDDWQASRAYVALRGSYALNANSSTTWAPASPPTAIRASYGSGGGGSLALGFHLPLSLRLELEALYRWQPVSRVSVGGLTSVASGSSRTAAPMLNLFWDVPLPDDYWGLQPFVGMGVGAAYSDVNVYDAANTYSRQNRWDLAYSFMTGLTLPLSEGSRVSAMYRWMQLRDAGHKCAAGGTIQSVCLDNSVSSSAVDLGLEMDL